MNFNNIKDRLSLINLEIDEYSKIPIKFQIQIDNQNYISEIKFTERENDDTSRNIYTIITAISTLKDLIKKDLELRNLDSKLIESFITSDTRLCVLMDLNNKLKHGVPLRKSRSNLNPTFTNIIDGLSFSNSSISPIIHADIVDNDGNLICTLQQLIRHSLRKFNHFIIAHNL